MQDHGFDQNLPCMAKRKRLYQTLIVFAVILCLFCILFGGAYFLNSNLTKVDPEKTEEETVTEGIIKSYADEIRGVYIASAFHLNFPSSKGLDAQKLQFELDSIVSECSLSGFNIIYFQVRPSADALYASKIFPSSRFLVGSEGDPIPMDPLDYLIKKAKENGIDVVAWVNPYRVTTSSFESKEEALASLSDQNIAKQNPDWTFLYGGKLYFDPGVSSVQTLIAEGVKEICSLYDVKGVLFDDYFYPYPVSGEEIPDRHTYKASNTTLSVDDWRRENVNRMVKLSYEAVKSVSKEMTFGISPFGIWQNASSDKNGSETAGMEAYSALYCDALAWVRGGYVDYLSPQLYWDREHPMASFSVLAQWWDQQLKGTGVKLIISHSAYKSLEFSKGGQEIAAQIALARKCMTSCGSIQYGFSDIQNNSSGVKDALIQVFSETNQEDFQ